MQRYEGLDSPAPITMLEQESPLSDEERLFVTEMLANRRRVANRFALLAAIPTAGFVFLRLLDAAAGPRANRPAHYGISMALVIVMAVLVWYFGYRLVRLIAKDLEVGNKQQKQGNIEAIESHGNTYGETITYLTLGGERLMTRGRFFDLCRGGEEVVVSVLPLSRVVIAGRVVGA